MRAVGLAGLLATCLVVAAQEAPQLAPAVTSDRTNEDYDQPPKLIKQTRPRYPRDAFEKRIQGMVLLEIIIDEKGDVSSLRVLKSVPELDKAALDCVKKWKFAPATKDDHAVATIARVPVTFKRF